MANNKNFVVKNGLTVGTDATIGSTLYVSTVDTTDSSAITVVPSTTFNSDVNIQNDLRVTNAIENASGNTILPAILGAADQVLSVNSAGNSASWKSISDIFGGGIDNVVDDTTPQLGGDLDLNSQDITGTGNISITGTVTADQLVLSDNEKIKMGAGADLEIYHDGSHSYVDDRGTGDLRLRGNGSVKIMQYNNSEQMAAFKVNGAVELYHDNVKKFDTTSTGVDVTGTITADGATIDGDISATGSLFVPTIDTSDSSAITVVPSATFNSDVTVENTLYSTAAFIDNLGVPDALYVDLIKPRPETGNNLTISGEVSFSGTVNANMFDTADSSAIVFFPAIEFESDVNIQNDLRVTNQVDAARFKGNGSLLTNIQTSLHDLTDTSVGGQGTNTLLKYNGADYVPTSLVEDSSGDITASGKVKINYSSTSTPALSIESTDSTSDASPELELYKNSTSADGHYLGQIKFAGENDTGGKVNYAKITGKILDNTNGTEDGILEFAFQKGGSQNISARFRSDSLQLINGTNITVNGTSTFDDAVTVNANIIITGTVDGRDVATDGTKLDTIETNATADQTAAEILAALITVDGTGTSLDADLLDGQHGSHYLDGSNFTGTLPNNYVTLGTMTTGDYMINVSGTANEIEITHTQAEGSTATIGLPDDVTIGNELTVTTALFTPIIDTTDSSGITVVPSTTFNSDVNIQNDLRVTNSIENASGSTLLPATLGTTNQVLTVNAAGNAAWSTISTGALNNVVEDTTPQLGGDLDLNSQDITGTGNIDITGDIAVSGTVDGRDVATDGTKLDGIESGATADQTASEILTAIKTVDGTGSGLDADTVDGIEAAAITQSGDSVALTGDVTGSTTVSASGEISIATTIAANSITLGTDTTGDYVATVTGTTNEVEVTGSGGETAAVTVGLPSDVTVSNNLTVGGYLAGPASFTIDPAGVGDNTGTVIIAGDLQVDGTTTTINSTTVTVDDLNLTLASGSANAAAANGAGITVDGANATITYDSTNDEWDFNKNVNITGNLIASGTINTLQVNNGNGDDAFSTAVGVDALVSANSGTLRNTAIGWNALTDNTSGERNTAIGQAAMANATTGSYNTAIGLGVMGTGIVTGNHNTGIGITALDDLTSGTFNTAIGSQSPLGQTTTGQSNTAIGPYVLINNQAGSHNVAVGRSALAGASLGDYTGNTVIGTNALDGLNPGQNNHTVIGFRAGRDLDTGTENIIIGYDAEASATAVSNEITLGDTGSKSFRIPGSEFYINGGSEGTTGSNVGIGTSTPTGKVEIEEDGAVNDRLLYLNSAGGLSGGQSGPFYGLYADIKSNNSATEAYGAYIEALGGGSDNTYGIWAQATQDNSTKDAIGVLGKTIVASGSTNHGSERALGTGPAAGVYALAETTGTGTASQTTALHASNASTHGSLAYGAYIETISGPTTVVPLKVDHAGSEIFKVDSAGDATIGNELTVTTALFTPIIDTTDSSAITITPAAVFSSDVTIQNDLRVNNSIENAAGQTILPSTIGSAAQVLTVNAAGTGAEWAAATGGGVSSRTEEHPTVTNGAATVTMGAAYTLAQLDVYLNGARMKSGTDYSVSSTTLTFSENLSTGDVVALYAYDTTENLITGNWSDLNDVSVTGASANAMVRYDGGSWAVGQSTEDSSGNLAVAGSITADNVTGTGNVNAAGNVTAGNVIATGSLLVPTIDTADSSAITVTPAAVFSSDVTVENDLTVSNDVTATVYYGDGSQLTGISAGATGGSTDQVFYENDQVVTTNYTISTNKNAMTAGPITVNSGVTVTIPTGSEWSIV